MWQMKIEMPRPHDFDLHGKGWGMLAVCQRQSSANKERRYWRRR